MISLVFSSLAILVVLLTARILLLLLFKHGRPIKSGSGPVKTMVVLGSGAFLLAEAAHAACLAAALHFPLQPPIKCSWRKIPLSLQPPSPSPRTGGHTAEMLMMVEKLDKQHYSPRVYVAAATDRMSGTKALTKEQTWGAGSKVRLRCLALSRGSACTMQLAVKRLW